MTTDKRVEEIVDKLIEENYWTQEWDGSAEEIKELVLKANQDLMNELVEKIEGKKYPKDSTQGCNCNGYNNALTEAQTIIKNLTREIYAYQINEKMPTMRCTLSQA